MAVTSGFFNSLNGDRKYNAEQMSALFDGIINDGVFANIGSAFMVTADSENTVNIGVGRAWFNSTWVNNDAILPLSLDNSEVLLNRIDAIVIEINRTEAIREGRIIVVKGTPASSASRPELANEDAVHQHPLAYIYRGAGTTSITQADITNMIGTSACPYITGILQVQDIDKNVAQWQSQFEIWFSGLEAILEDDVAANLAAKVTDLDNRFEDLARDRAVYEPLQDDTNDTILDSNGQPILGSTIFGSQSVAAGTEVSEETIIEGDSFEVGDILTTARSTPGAEWLLCDGSVLNRSDYPKLSQVLPESSVFDKVTIFSGGGIKASNIKLVNGYYMVLVSNANYFFYANSLSGPWTKCTVNPTVSQNSYLYVKDIIYADGNYVVAMNGTYTGVANDKNSVIIAYSPSLTGTWSGKMLDYLRDDGAVIGIAYGGGYFAVMYWYMTGTSHTFRVFYSTSLTGRFNSTSEITNVYYNDTHTSIQFDFIDGKFVFLLYYRDSDDHYNLDLHYISGAPNGSWTSKNIYKKPDKDRFYSTNIVVNGNRYFIATLYNGTEMQSSLNLYSADSIEGTWTSEEYPIQKDCDRYHSRYFGQSTAICPLVLEKGELIMYIGRYDEVYSDYYGDSQNGVTLYGVSKIKIEDGVGAKEESIESDVSYLQWVVAISNDEDIGYIPVEYNRPRGEFFYFNPEKMALPSIEVNGAKAFIKVLE